MKRISVLALALLAPVVMFAQVPGTTPGTALLKRLGLTDDQVAKASAIVSTTETTIKDDMVHIRLLEAQIDDAIMPSTAKPDMNVVNKLVDQEMQLRGDMQKALLSAKVQLIQIMGRDNFERYWRSLRLELAHGGRGAFRAPMMRGFAFRGAQGPQGAPGPQGGPAPAPAKP